MSDSTSIHSMKSQTKGPFPHTVGRVVSSAPTDMEAARPAPVGELKVQFSGLAMAALCFVSMSTYQAWAGTMITGLYSGGPVGMIYGFIVVFLCSACSVASLAEMVSIWPTAEGQIAWAEHLAPPKVAKFTRYWVGWLTALGHVFFSAASAFVWATLVIAFATLANPAYVAPRWHTSVVCITTLILSLFVNVFGVRWFGAINYATAAVGAATLIVLICVLTIVNPVRNSASFVFTEFINETGWDSKGVVFLLGMVSAAFSMIGYDSVAHMTEEMHSPAREAPRAMMGAILVSGVTGFVFIITVLFSIQGIEDLAVTPFPYLYMLYNKTNSASGSIVLGLSTLICAPIAAIMIMASSSRILMSFAREGGLPFSPFFAKVSPTKQLPINALCFSTALQSCLSLVYIGNTALFNSLLVLTIATLNISYAVPNALMLFRGRRLGLPPAPFSLGRLGPVVNAIALTYNIVISVFLFFPNFLPVSALNMNYASAIFGLVHVVLGVYWFAGGRAEVHKYAAARRSAGEGGSQQKLEE